MEGIEYRILMLFYIFMKENEFQARLIKKLKTRFPGCIILKNDPTYIQGIPDLIVLHEGKWAALECKRSEKAKHQPNQEHYVGVMNDMSFARFIFPENEEEVLDEIQSTFQSDRASCHVQSKPISLD